MTKHEHARAGAARVGGGSGSRPWRSAVAGAGARRFTWDRNVPKVRRDVVSDRRDNPGWNGIPA